MISPISRLRLVFVGWLTIGQEDSRVSPAIGRTPHRVTMLGEVSITSRPDMDPAAAKQYRHLFASPPAGPELVGPKSFSFSLHDLTYYSRIFSVWLDHKLPAFALGGGLGWLENFLRQKQNSSPPLVSVSVARGKPAAEFSPRVQRITSG